MTLATIPGLTFPLGSTSDGTPVTLDLTNSSGTLLNGPCGSGKTVFLRHLVKACAEARGDTLVIDPIRRGVNFRNTPSGAVVTDRAEAVEELGSIAADILRRQALFEKYKVSRWQELPEEVRQSESVQPIVVFIDEYDSLVHLKPLPKSAELDAEYSREIREHNDQVNLMLDLVGEILRKARFCGVHLIISVQRADFNSISPSMRDHLENVIMTLRPGYTLRETPVAMAFGLERTPAVLAAAQEGEGTAYGDAVIATATAGVQRLNLPYSE